MRGKTPEGQCCICGNYATLSFEHVPPKAAFNDSPIRLARFQDAVGLGPYEKPLRTTQQQRGAGGYTLCSECNNKTGAWYGGSYAEWAIQAMDLLLRSHGEPTLMYPYWLYPLRVIKQVVAMFCSANGPGFTGRFPYLRSFLLSPEQAYLPPDLRIYAYLNWTGVTRQTGMVGMANLAGKPFTMFSELTWPPFGYVMTIRDTAPNPDMVEISHFARYLYDDFKQLYLRFPVLETHMWFPGDYRRLEDIKPVY